MRSRLLKRKALIWNGNRYAFVCKRISLNSESVGRRSRADERQNRISNWLFGSLQWPLWSLARIYKSWKKRAAWRFGCKGWWTHKIQYFICVLFHFGNDQNFIQPLNDYIMQGETDKCIKTLIKAKRIPEAAFFAKTYCPSKISEIVELWKQDLQKGHKITGNSLFQLLVT